MIDPCNFCDKKECPKICYKKHEYLWWLLEVKEGKTMDKLKPCPFCGSFDIEATKIDDTGEWYLECGDCGIEQPLYKNFADAVNAWNRRAGDA